MPITINRVIKNKIDTLKVILRFNDTPKQCIALPSTSSLLDMIQKPDKVYCMTGKVMANIENE